MRAFLFCLLLVPIFAWASDCKSGSSSNCHICNGTNCPAKEVNLGPVPLDHYTDTNNGYLNSSCSDTVQNCIKSWLGDYKTNQGVTGVRFQFGLGGGAYSTPFCTNGDVNNSSTCTSSATWATNLNSFFADIHSKGISNITATPMLGWVSGDGYSYYSDQTVSTCVGTVGRRFMAWLPYGLVYNSSANDYWPDCQGSNTGYTNAPANTTNFWSWTPFYNLVDLILSKAASNSLTVTEFDIQNEIDVQNFTVAARLIYDTTQTPAADVLGTVRTKMSNHSFSTGAVTYSTQATMPSYDGYDCGSIYGDTALVVTESQITGAINGGLFGLAASNANGLACSSGDSSSMISLPNQQSYTQPTIHDVHVHICINYAGHNRCYDPVDDSGTLDPNNVTIGSTYGSTTSRNIYSGLWNFLSYHSLTSHKMMLGEVNHTMSSLCDGYKTNNAYMNVNGFNGFSYSGSTSSSLFQNAAANTTFRVWLNGQESCFSLPATISPPYTN